MSTIKIDTNTKRPATRNGKVNSLPPPKTSQRGSNTNAKLRFIGTATTILEWNGLRLMTDPNFLHAGDHVHLGPGVTGTRLTNPAIDLEDLPPIDVILLSHYHADHFDQLVEENLRRDIPIITTPHAESHLSNKEDAFTKVTAIDAWESTTIEFESKLSITGMPGKHVGDGAINTLNEYVKAVPPTNGWILEFGDPCGYRIYISGDTLYVNDLKKIPEMYTHAGKPIDLMLIHLGGTTIPGPSLPLLMVTMDAKQGLQLVKLIRPKLTIPIHYE